jgi:6-phosphogluconolactonase (cycloisomerase 2 family)
MFRDMRGTVCMCALMCTLAGCASSAPDPPATTSNEQNGNTSNVVAYVYVSNKPKPSTTTYAPSQITAYAADSNGTLTAVPGSPFNQDVGSMAVNGLYLMAAANTTPTVNAYNIHPDGSLTLANQTNYAQDNEKNCGNAGALFFDHASQSLYLQESRIDCANSGIATYTVNSSTGMLSYLGNTITGSEYDNDNPATFIGNNLFAYAAGPPGCYIYSIDGFQRASNGLLSSFDAGAPAYLPGSPGSFRDFVPDLAAADTTNHVAIAEIPANPPGCAGLPVSISTWTADANGRLTTTSTYANMPTTAIVNPLDLKMAPSGQLLAIAGKEGLQVLHFNGAQPATIYTPLLTTDPINMMFWDNNNHLYAISQSANKIHVFTITDTSSQEAAGSPYTISSPDDLIIQPWPLS